MRHSTKNNRPPPRPDSLNASHGTTASPCPGTNAFNSSGVKVHPRCSRKVEWHSQGKKKSSPFFSVFSRSRHWSGPRLPRSFSLLSRGFVACELVWSCVMTSIPRSTGGKLKSCLPWRKNGTVGQPANPPPPHLAAMLESHRAAAGPASPCAPPPPLLPAGHSR